MTNKEAMDWVTKEYAKADATEDRQKANQIRYRAKIIFDKRFPNPDICCSCGRIERRVD